MQPKIDRQALRGFLLLIMFVIGIFAISGCIGQEEAPETVTTTKMVTEAAETVTTTKTVAEAERKIKAAFIYVGPIGDYGWSHAHDQGRLYVENQFDWLETVYAEAVPEADVDRYIDRFIQEEKCDIVFTTSFGFMDGTIAAGERYPDKVFMHCSGYKRSVNVGTYFAEFYQLYYLNGLMAGALTKTNKLGYVAAHPIPEVIRHINAFTLGAKEVNPEIEVHVRWLFAWYDPTLARAATEELITLGCDAIAFTEDSPTVLQVGQEHTELGDQIYTFSHYSPMQSFGPDTCVSGQLVRWDVLYEEILMRLYLGVWDNRDYYYLLAQGAVELGGEYGVPVNPKFKEELEAKWVTDPILGSTNVYGLVKSRLDQMSEVVPPYDPFTGPIFDQDGALKVKDGERLGHDPLWMMDYFVEGVVDRIP